MSQFPTPRTATNILAKVKHTKNVCIFHEIYGRYSHSTPVTTHLSLTGVLFSRQCHRCYIHRNVRDLAHKVSFMNTARGWVLPQMFSANNTFTGPLHPSMPSDRRVFSSFSQSEGPLKILFAKLLLALKTPASHSCLFNRLFKRIYREII